MLCYNKLLHWRSKVKQLKGANINAQRMEMRRVIGKVEEQEVNAEEV